MTRASRAKRALRGLALLSGAVALAASCVPVTEELNPRGAILIRTEPSPTTRGAPLTTSDGWTVYVEDIVVMALFSAGVGDVGSGNIEEQLFRASEPTEAIIRAVQAGPAAAQLRYTRWRIGRPRSSTEIGAGIDEGLRARFDAVGDGETLGNCGGITPNFRLGPSLHLRVRAEKGGRTVRLDLALLRSRIPSMTVRSVDVRANDLTPAPFPIVAEELFKNEQGALVFDDLARADSDGDGEITGQELCDTRVPLVPSQDADASPDADANPDANANADANADADADANADASAGADADANADASADAGADANADAGPTTIPLVEVLRTRANRLFGP
ncbi:MAG: hypothetical protein R3B36_34320 [Polyangiaceae bacterium]